MRWLGFSLLFCLRAWAVDPIATAFPAPARLVLDGDLVDWNPGRFSVSPVVDLVDGVGFLEEGQVSSNADHSARVYFAWRPDALWVGARLTDDTVTVVRGDALWKGDTFEVLLGHGDGRLFHLGVNPVGDVQVFSGHSAVGVKAAALRLEQGWSVELSVPWTALGFSAAPKSVRVNLGLRDVDGEEVAYRVWSGQRHAQRDSAATLRLESAAPPPSWPTCAPWAGTVNVVEPLKARGTQLMAGASPVVLRMVNYQPARNNWPRFWTEFDPQALGRDLDLAAKLRINALRVFVFTEEFGGPTVRPEVLERLRRVVREGAARGMVSIVTFFPFKKELRPEWDTRMAAHLTGIVSAFRGDPAIAMWDLMNEPDHLLTTGATWNDLARWAQVMATAVRTADPTHLVTIGLAAPSSSNTTVASLEVQSVHWYGEQAQLGAALDLAVDAGQPVILQEFGSTSLYFGDAESSRWFDEVCRAAAARHLAGVGAWELFDHPVGSILHLKDRWVEEPEHDFGLLRMDGAPKGQAGAFCRCLAVPQLRLGGVR